VPTAALFRRGNDWTAFVVEGGKARLKKVEIDHKNNEAAEVRSGLAEGQRVILYSADTISDGVAVKVMPELWPSVASVQP
jgi:HlyD family secretion protein